jgi:hypothetical protein
MSRICNNIYYNLLTSKILVNDKTKDELGWTSGYDVIKMSAVAHLLKNGNLYYCYLSMKFHKWGIKMTATNSLTHVRSTHTNVENS